MTTREKIVYESLKLFSTNGFEAVSVRTIAQAVGVTNSALYKHFGSKQEILDEIVSICKDRYIARCSMVNADIRGVEQVKDICLSMYIYQTSDEWIVMFRRLLVVEMFKNQLMANIYKEFFVDYPLSCQVGIFTRLISMGLMKKRDPATMAMELYAPFFMYHLVPENEKILNERFMLHAEYFFENNIIKENK